MKRGAEEVNSESFIYNMIGLVTDVFSAILWPSTPASFPPEEDIDRQNVKKRPLKKKKPKMVSAPVVIDLASDSSESESEEELIFLDDSPEEIAEIRQHAQRNKTLTLQYAQKLGIDAERSKASLENVHDNHYQVKSIAQQKYKEKSKKQTLQKLAGSHPMLGVEGARRLLQNEWLDDSSVTFFLKSLVEKKSEICVLDSLFSTKKNFFTGLRSKNKIFDKLNKELQSARRILWPICHDLHWYLVIMDKKKDGRYDLFCLDSFNSKLVMPLKKAADFLQAMFPEKELDELVAKQEYIEILRQNNMRDCGVSVCFWGERAIRNKTLPHSQKGTCDYSPFRIDIAECLARDKAKEDQERLIEDEGSPIRRLIEEDDDETPIRRLIEEDDETPIRRLSKRRKLR